MPLNHNVHPRPSNLSPAHDDGSFAAAPQPPTPLPPAQPARDCPAQKNPWGDPVVDNVPQPSPLKHVAAYAPCDKKPYPNQPPPAAHTRDPQDIGCDETDLRQPTTASKPGATQTRARVNKPRFDKIGQTDKPRGDRLRVDKPQTDKPHSDKPQGEKPQTKKPSADKPHADKLCTDKQRADKPCADKPWVDKPHVDKPCANMPRARKPRVNMPQGMSLCT